MKYSEILLKKFIFIGLGYVIGTGLLEHRYCYSSCHFVIASICDKKLTELTYSSKNKPYYYSVGPRPLYNLNASKPSYY